MTLGPIAGLSAGWLVAGAAACALPVVAHLLGRRARRIVFPPVAIFAQALAEGARGRRLREWARLAVRVLIITLVALAFDRPVWRRPGAGAAAAGEDALILLDRSASMTRSDGGRSLFERARDACSVALRDLDPSRDRAAVVLVDASPAPVLPEWTHNLDALAGRVRGVQRTLERGDSATAFSIAQDFIERSGRAHRRARVIVLSDGQATQWADAPETLGGARIDWRTIGESNPRNSAIEGFLWPEGGLRAGRAGRVGVRVRGLGGAPARTLVTLETPEGAMTRAADLDPAGAGVAWFDLTAATPGYLPIRARLGPDGLDADNAAEALAPVVAAPRVVVATRAAETRALPALIISRATEAATGSAPVIAAVDGSFGAGADIVVVVGAGKLIRERLDEMDGFLDGGGGILWVVDSAGAAASLAAASARQWSPVVTDGIWRAGAAAIGIDARSAETFFDPGGAAEPGVIASLARGAMVTGRAPAEAREGALALRLADGSALAAVGASRVAVVLADLAPASSSIARTPILPMLVDRLLGRVLPVARAPIPARPGEAAPIEIKNGWRPWVNPVDAPVFTGHDRPPAHTLRASAWVDSDGRPAASIVLTIDPAESDLRSAPTPGADAPVRSADASGGVETDDRAGVALWPWLAIAAFALAMGEAASGAVGAMRGGRRRGVAA